MTDNQESTVGLFNFVTGGVSHIVRNIKQRPNLIRACHDLHASPLLAYEFICCFNKGTNIGESLFRQQSVTQN
jgi:hypothetical protein